MPFENITKRRISKIFNGPFTKKTFLNLGMVSDDTEHTLFTVLSLIKHSCDVDKFRDSFSWFLGKWILTIPLGIGLGTLKAIIKLCFGVSPERSGVFSAGNGPSMKVAIIGGFFYNQKLLRNQFVRAWTEITHSDARALIGATAVLEISSWSITRDKIERPTILEFI